jgi:Secretory pathway protein Sec39
MLLTRFFCQEFNIAKKLLQNPNVKKVDAKTIENLCLTVSREFYDNASSGNLHHGDMKLAYDWSVPWELSFLNSPHRFGV